MTLHVDHLSAGYGGGTAIADITLHVEPGTIHTIIGPNGAGKTTLLHTIAGLLPATAGRITLAGVDLTRLPAWRRARHSIRLMPQDHTLFARLTVTQHLRLAGQDSATVTALLERLPALARQRGHRPGQLSGGQQAMLALACALAGQPRLLLLDEPGDGLAPDIARVMHDLITDAAAHASAVLVTASRPTDVHPASQTTHLRNGRIQPTRPPLVPAPATSHPPTTAHGTSTRTPNRQPEEAA